MAQNITIDNVEIRKRYYASGALSREVPYVNGKEHGIVKWYHESGALMAEAPYVNGKVHGIVRGYYESGALRREVPYVNGETHGISREYDKDNSNVCCLTLYDNDHKVASVKI